MSKLLLRFVENAASRRNSCSFMLSLLSSLAFCASVGVVEDSARGAKRRCENDFDHTSKREVNTNGPGAYSPEHTAPLQ